MNYFEYMSEYIKSGGSGTGGLPIVELSTMPVDENGILVTAEESAQLDAAFDTGLPCVVKFSNAINEENYQRMSLIMYRVEVCFCGEYQMGFTCMVSNASAYNYDRTDNGWVARIQGM